MNKSHQIPFKKIVLGLCLIGSIGYGQKQTKEYQETFNAGDETVININTSYADIEFETWNKNQIVVEATIELEGASEEEAEAYFSNGGIEILGNSREIKISTAGNQERFFSANTKGLENIVIEIPDMEPLFLDLQIPDLPEIPEIIRQMPMPPIPPMQFNNFDYEAYKRDGEKYLEEWTKEFEKSFDKEYQEELEAWSKEMESRMHERERAREEMMREREEILEEREELKREAHEARSEAQEARRMAMEAQREIMEEHEDAQHEVRVYKDINVSPNVFYRSSDGQKRNYKIKKTIKVKMPKSTKLKMNVRHGEVKLAENTKNINATLSYARLLASTIDGDKTNIVASYSPVAVQNWKYGELSTNYSEGVDLKEVRSLTLNANSSNVTIERLTKNALIKNDFGLLKIITISDDFKDLNIKIKNGELICKLPITDYEITVEQTESEFQRPDNLNLVSTKQGNLFSYKGYNLRKDSQKSIYIDSEYSEITLQN